MVVETKRYNSRTVAEEADDSIFPFAQNANTGSAAANVKDNTLPDGQAGTVKHSGIKVKHSELIVFTSQLSVMIDSGVVLSDSLDAIADQTEDVVFKSVIEDISAVVKSGENFSEALIKYPGIFNPMFISMVEASEASGRMVEMLCVLNGYLEFEYDTGKKIKGALTYPLIMASMAIVSVVTLMFFVLPRFTKIYEAKGAALPRLTQMLVTFSKMLTDLQSMTIFLTFLIVAVIVFYYWVGSKAGKRAIDFLKIHTPVLGTMFVDTVITRSMRIMATMVNTGVNLLDALKVIKGACDNSYFQRLWTDTDKKIRDGYQLSESIQLAKDNKLIAPGIIHMLRAGEECGKLGEVSEKISTFYEKKLKVSIKNVTALIEPLMLVFLGTLIGGIAIALLLPVFKISSVVTQ